MTDKIQYGMTVETDSCFDGARGTHAPVHIPGQQRMGLERILLLARSATNYYC